METPNHRYMCDLMDGHLAETHDRYLMVQTDTSQVYPDRWGTPGSLRRPPRSRASGGGLEKPNHRYICDLMDGHVADSSRAQDRCPTVQSDASGLPTSLGHA